MNPGSDPDIVLALCPPWGVGNPPLGLAYLATSLRRQGLSAGICDINLHLFRWSKRSEKSLWDVGNDITWSDEEQADLLMDLWEPKVSGLVESLVASPVRVLGFTVVDPNEAITCRVIRRIKGETRGAWSWRADRDAPPRPNVDPFR